MKRLIFIFFIVSLILFLSFGCTKPHWTQTKDGKYIYGAFNDKYELEWNGQSNAIFVDGPGQLSLYNKGKLKEKIDLTTKLGAISKYPYVNTPVGDYLGETKHDLPHEFGVLISNDIITIGEFKKGNLFSGRFEKYQLVESRLQPLLLGNVRKGKITGITREYHNGELIYEGSFKNGLRHGVGRAYSNNILVYNGEWKKGQKHGEGIQYKESGLIKYQGKWKNDKYHGNGKLYDKGICSEGKWEDGKLTKSISTSIFTELSRTTKMWFSSDSLIAENNGILQYKSSVPTSQIEFIEGLNDELRDYLYTEVDKRVDNRFGFWNLLRMFCQPWFSSDVKRASSAQKYFCKNIQSKDVERLINEKVSYYNQMSEDKLSFVSLNKLPNDAIVNTTVALKIFDREALETVDIVVGILVDIIICCIIAFCIGFIIGFFIPSLIPYAFWFDIILGVLSLCICFYLSLFRTSALSIELEATIKQMLVDNYMVFIDSQNIITQLLGL